jgi:hypothetical protein
MQEFSNSDIELPCHRLVRLYVALLAGFYIVIDGEFKLLPQFLNGGGLVGYEVVDEEYFSMQHIVFDRGFNGALIALIGKHFHLYTSM